MQQNVFRVVGKVKTTIEMNSTTIGKGENDRSPSEKRRGEGGQPQIKVSLLIQLHETDSDLELEG